MVKLHTQVLWVRKASSSAASVNRLLSDRQCLVIIMYLNAILTHHRNADPVSQLPVNNSLLMYNLSTATIKKKTLRLSKVEEILLESLHCTLRYLGFFSLLKCVVLEVTQLTHINLFYLTLPLICIQKESKEAYGTIQVSITVIIIIH